jgi:hypothetical protein
MFDANENDSDGNVERVLNQYETKVILRQESGESLIFKLRILTLP